MTNLDTDLSKAGADSVPPKIFPPLKKVSVLDQHEHPVIALVVRRFAAALLTLVLVSMAVFLATQVLPGNAARAILGPHSTLQAQRALAHHLGLDQPLVTQYVTWFAHLLRGNFGTSMATSQSVTSVIGPRLINSAFLVTAAGFIGTALGVGLGVVTAARRDTLFDHVTSSFALVTIALPEFVIGILLILLFATGLFHWLPAVSFIPPGTYAWNNPRLVVLPVMTLVIVIVPYIYRMVRATLIDTMSSSYVEMAELKGLSPRRVLLRHAMPNAMAPAMQTIGLNVLYLAGGIVVVEYLFNFPGIGQGLVNAVSDRDLPLIQASVLILAAFYMVVNILTDVASLLLSPLRRNPR